MMIIFYGRQSDNIHSCGKNYNGGLSTNHSPEELKGRYHKTAETSAMLNIASITITYNHTAKFV